ncbi:YIEGIA domain-containing protein [Oscillospiraceae bacterium LTW-04]|nr:YIEGIA domain-containing protein [Oscillospiraceae bacterium MB24-C1]
MEAVEKTLQQSDIVLILSGIIMGTVARIITLNVDYRQNPSYPGGFLINLITGFVAAVLGSVAIPALLARNFTAVTFLTIGVQHFRDIRKLEMNSLSKLEDIEYTQRGAAYIDGIAKTYEARNYISLLTSLFTVLAMKIFYADNLIVDCLVGLVTGLIAIYIFKTFTKGKTIGDICDISEGKITIEHSELFVDGMFVTNLLGTDRSRALFLNEGIAVVITPKKDIFRITLDNFGQRQAILFEAARSFGVKRFRFTRKNYKSGKLIVAFVPIIHNIDALVSVVKKTPILENSRKIHSIMSSYSGGNQNG